MPTLPSADKQRRAITSQTSRIQSYTPVDPSGGAAMAQGLESAARGLGDAGEVMDQVAEKEAIAVAQEKENEARQKFTETMYGDGESPGLLSQKMKNALDVDKKFDQRADQIKNEVTKDVSHPMAREELEKSVERMRQSHRKQVLRHKTQERRDFSIHQTDVAMQSGLTRAALDYKDDEIFQDDVIPTVESAAVEKGKMKGFGSEGIENLRRSARSKAYAQRIRGYVGSGETSQILKAEEMYQQAKENGDLTLEDASELRSSLNELTINATASQAIENMQAGGSVDDVDMDTQWEAIQDIEGEQQMTGLETGMDQLSPTETSGGGKEYFEKQVKKFDNTKLGMLAYKTGPKVVNDFINGTNNSGKNPEKKELGDPRKSDADIDKFVSRIPVEEAQTFMNEVSGKLERGDLTQMPYSEIQKKAQELEERKPGAGKKFLDLYDDRYDRIQDFKDRRKREAKDQIRKRVAELDGDWSQLSQEEQETAAKHGIDVTKYSGSTDPEVLNRWEALTPQQKRDIDLDDPAWDENLTYDKKNELRQEQIKLEQPESKFMQETIDREAQYFMSSRDETSDLDPGGDAYKTRIGSMKRYMKWRVDSHYKRAGEVPDSETVSKFAKDYFKAMHEGSSMWGGEYWTSIDDIPDDKRNMIERGLRELGQPVTEESVIGTYRGMREAGFMDENASFFGQETSVSEDAFVQNNNQGTVGNLLQTMAGNQPSANMSLGSNPPEEVLEEFTNNSSE